MKITVNNFQSLRDTSIVAEGLTVLVGPSDRGKSALIRAVEGALFNRPGDEFVSQGETTAKVTLDDLPGLGKVIWEKGGGVNRFTVNGQIFSKVGGAAPDVIEAAGYRDLWVGDKEKKRGEYIRPQVARQFDPLFLLTRLGSFVSDVLSIVSRHTVLLAAQSRCSADLKREKSTLNIRREDLTAESARLDVLAPVPDLLARVERLRRMADVTKQLSAKCDVIRGLIAKRAALSGYLAQPIPAPVEVPAGLGERETRVRGLAISRQRYHTAIRTIAALTIQRVVGLDVVETQATKARDARVLLERRALCVRVAQAAFPTSFADKIDVVVQWDDTRGRLAQQVTRRVPALATLQRAQAAIKAATVEAEGAEASLATLLASVKVCPVCEQPMRSVAVGV